MRLWLLYLISNHLSIVSLFTLVINFGRLYAEMFKEYDKKIHEMLGECSDKIEWLSVHENHRYMISLIQHERLIHLLVTIFVGIGMILCVLTTLVTELEYLLLLDIPLLALFTAYIFHYRFLENTTQSWYLISEKIKDRSRKS